MYKTSDITKMYSHLPNTLLWCILLIFIPHNSLAYSISGMIFFLIYLSGQQITDLEFQSTDFSNEVSSWGYSFVLGNGPISICNNTSLLGGYLINKPNESMYRTYYDLPTHDVIMITVQVWRIDNLDSADGFTMTVDGAPYTFVGMTGSFSNMCGASFGDAGAFTIAIKKAHTASSVLVNFTNNCNQMPFEESFGIRDISIVAKYIEASESMQAYQQGTATATTPPPGTTTINCPTGQYYTGSACASCHASCFACIGDTNSDCLRCNYNYYYSFLGTCLSCGANCRTCSAGAVTNCTTCITGYYLFPDKSCRPLCGGTVDLTFPATCVCPSTRWYYANGTCNKFCRTGYSATNTTIAYCNFKCSSGQYYYLNDTCLASCNSPLYSIDVYDGKICYFPCSTGDYYFQNGTCLSSCPSHMIVVDVVVGKYCNFPCSGSLFYYFNGTCSSICNFPLVNVSYGVENYCLLPCASKDYYVFMNSSCGLSCPSPYISQNISIGGVCYFPCATTLWYYSNGTCLSNCSFPFISVDVSVGKFCDFPCITGTFYYSNGSCIGACASPFTQRSVVVGNYCDFPCNSSVYYYRNGTCLSNCIAPLVINNINVSKICEFPCNTGFYYYQNGSCISSCPSPFTSRNISIGVYCDFPCSTSQYYFSNGSCLSTCPSPMFKTNITQYRYCNFPCTLSNYYYSNGSCLTTCPYPFLTRNVSVGQWCDFPCANATKFYYHNNTCLDTCKSPLLKQNVSIGIICNFPCSQSSYYYSNDTCIPECNAPMYSINVSIGSYCNFPCAMNKYYLANGTCVSNCNCPFLATNVSVGLYCDFICTSNNTFMSNGSCIGSCVRPFFRRTIGVELYCDYFCNSTEYLYPNDTCINKCNSPFLKRIDYTYKYCDFPCNATQFYFSNGTCVSNCSDPFLVRNTSWGMYCDFPCNNSTEFFYDLFRTCIKSCPSPNYMIYLSVGKICVSHNRSIIQEIYSSIEGFSIAVAAISLPISVSEPFLFWDLVYMYQDLLGLYFMNLDFPLDAKAFLQVFDIGNFFMMPKIQAILNPEDTLISENHKDAYANFEYSGFTTLFIDSVSRLITTWIIFIFFAGIITLVNIATEKKYKAIKSIVDFKGIPLLFRFWMGTYYPFLISAFLQVLSLDFGTGIQAFSSILSIVTLLGFIGTIAFIIMKIRRMNRMKSNDKKDKQAKRWPALYDGVILTDKIAVNYILIETLRRGLKAIIAVFLYNSPGLQTGLSVLLSLPTLWFILTYHPFSSGVRTSILIIKESVLVIAQMIIFLEATLRFKMSRDNVGYLLIAVTGFGVLVMQTYTLLKIFKMGSDYILKKHLMNNDADSKKENPFQFEEKNSKIMPGRTNPFDEAKEADKSTARLQDTTERDFMSFRKSNSKAYIGSRALED